MRRPTTERIRALEERKRQIEAQLQSLSARERDAERKRDTRRKVIVGAAVLAHADLNPNFADLLREVLVAAVQRPADRQTIADLIDDFLNALIGRTLDQAVHRQADSPA